MKKHFIFSFTVPAIIYAVLLMSSCGNKNNEADAYGNFEAGEVIVSAQTQGIIVTLDITEGSQLQKGKIAGRIDSSTAAIKRDQLKAQQSVIQARMRNLDAQLRVQEEQRINMEREVDRMKKLLEDKAATGQQFDDLAGKLRVLDSQTEALISQKGIITGEQAVLNAQLDEVGNLLEKCRIISPINGTVLEKYADAGELVIPGKALFKVADISHMELKVYVSGSQLSAISIGDSVTVIIDAEKDKIQSLPGVISWISSQVEFTPKIIQTREERVNMVYAVKILVNNDGRLKIGMPGEVIFEKKQ